MVLNDYTGEFNEWRGIQEATPIRLLFSYHKASILFYSLCCLSLYLLCVSYL